MGDGAPHAQQATSADQRTEGREERELTIGLLVADPSSRELADMLANELSRELEQRFPDVRWKAEVKETTPAGPGTTSQEMLEAVRQRLLDEGWQLAIGLTDLPLRSGPRPVTALASTSQGVGLVSIPALGAVDVRQRVKEAALQVIDSVLGESGRSNERDSAADRDARIRRRVLELTSPIGHASVRDDGSLRFVGAVLRGNLRLLVGMIRANQPWLVIVRLSRAMIGALGTGALALVTATIWQLSHDMTWPRLIAVMVASVLVICVCLVVAHGVWERARTPQERERVALFNFATVTTLGIGVATLYVGLFVVFAISSGVFLTPAVFEQIVGAKVNVGDYLQLAWFVASMALIGGALGSLAERDQAVREAAYRPRDAGQSEQDDDEQAD